MNRIMDCPICGGNEYHLSEIFQSRHKASGGKPASWTSGFCFDCGWYEGNEPRSERSGFSSLEDLNEYRYNINKDPLTYGEFVAIRTRIKAPLDESENPNPGGADEYALVINRRRASRDP